jgi:hypothetical protein
MAACSCRIFVSYAHDSEDHKQAVLDYSDWLNDPGGMDCWIDRYVEDSDMPHGWPHWMMTQIEEAKYVLVVCSERYLARYYKRPEEEGKGLGVKFESTLIVNEFYQNGSLNIKFIPVIIKSEDAKYIPNILQSQTYYDLSRSDSRDALYRRISNQPQFLKPAVSPVIMFESSSALERSTKIDLDEPPPSTVELPNIPQFTNMKPGTKILQAFFRLPLTKRFAIASELGLLEKGESFESPNPDRLCASFLERAFNNNLMAELWSRLFDESIDPNPFKK